MIAISYSRGAFNERFRQVLAQATNPTAVLWAAGRELGNQLKAWFRKRDRENPNQLSQRREHVWLQIMRSVNAPEQTGYNAISVRVSDPRIAQKVFGGRIVAKAAGALTIPVEERAYGRTAATFEAETGLKLFLIRNGKGAFARAVLAAKEAGHLIVEYLLTPSVDQAADPFALPPQNELEAAILERAQQAADRQAKAEG